MKQKTGFTKETTLTTTTFGTEWLMSATSRSRLPSSATNGYQHVNISVRYEVKMTGTNAPRVGSVTGPCLSMAWPRVVPEARAVRWSRVPPSFISRPDRPHQGWQKKGPVTLNFKVRQRGFPGSLGWHSRAGMSPFRYNQSGDVSEDFGTDSFRITTGSSYAGDDASRGQDPRLPACFQEEREHIVVYQPGHKRAEWDAPARMGGWGSWGSRVMRSLDI
ncbi:hypothetical protein CCHR01_15070 [Colletotrichum chrysophilum]|uniref:Uncharacterized protein n=1 Tax=Colletotrichum chrysophilum TaxID=1836956 RepID=A0AAD9A6B3_9PEZI|nr:hypothetical protein CCHR01_15070 [Colletotrichum chrysophilum]